MDGVHKARAQGGNVTAQIAGRPVGVMLGIDTALNPFSIRPSYQALLQLPVAERIRRMQDPAFRAQVLNEAPSAELLNRLSQFRQRITTGWNRMFPMSDPPNYEPAQESSLGARCGSRWSRDSPIGISGCPKFCRPPHARQRARRQIRSNAAAYPLIL